MDDLVSREYLLKRLFFEVDRELVRRAPRAEKRERIKWISVDDMLPERVGTICLICANGYIEVGCWTHDKYGNDVWFYVDGEYEIGVTHWMQLPQPPK